MLETLQIINTIITITLGIFTFSITLSKPFRAWRRGVETEKKQHASEEVTRKETDKCLLRDRITTIYFKHRDEHEIRQYEFENVSLMYKQYKANGGNSFVDKIWDEMQEWRIVR